MKLEVTVNANRPLDSFKWSGHRGNRYFPHFSIWIWMILLERDKFSFSFSNYSNDKRWLWANCISFRLQIHQNAVKMDFTIEVTKIPMNHRLLCPSRPASDPKMVVVSMLISLRAFSGIFLSLLFSILCASSCIFVLMAVVKRVRTYLYYYYSPSTSSPSPFWHWWLTRARAHGT